MLPLLFSLTWLYKVSDEEVANQIMFSPFPTELLQNIGDI